VRSMVCVKMAEDVGGAPPELQEVMGRETQEGFASGSMVDAGGLHPTAASTEFRAAGGELDVPEVSQILARHGVRRLRAAAAP
jgi:hypothetical protein